MESKPAEGLGVVEGVGVISGVGVGGSGVGTGVAVQLVPLWAFQLVPLWALE